MKIGPLEVNLSRREAVELSHEEPPKPIGRRGEIGSPGTQIFGGELTQLDHATALSGNERYAVYDKMRKGDGQVKAGLAAVKLPLLRAGWKIERPDDSAQSREIEEYLTEHLFGGHTDVPWGKLLYKILLMLDYGSIPFEIVWEILDGKVHLRRLASRMPSSVNRWFVDDHGDFDGIEQVAYRGNRIENVKIPGSRMVLFINDEEGSDFRGVSLLRAAYKHWYFKDGFYRIDAIAKEKRAIGVDVMKLMGAVDEDRRKDAEAALMTLHAHEKQFMTEIEGETEYRIEGITGGVADALASIEHHDVRILRSILAEFIAMGERTARGSEAMHRDKTSFFIMALEAIGQEVLDPFNEDIIKPWVRWNWAGVKELPKLVHSRLEKRDMQAVAGAIARLVNVGAITADEPTEQRLREYLDLPLLEEGSPRPVPLPKGTPSTPPPQPQPNGNRRTQLARQQPIYYIRQAVQEPIREIENILLSVANDIRTKDQHYRIEDVGVPRKAELNDAVMTAAMEIWPDASLGQVRRRNNAAGGFTVMTMKGIKGAFIDLMKTEADMEQLRDRVDIIVQINARTLACALGLDSRVAPVVE